MAPRVAAKKKVLRPASRPKDKFITCPWCKKRKRFSDYWDPKKKSRMKFCRNCLYEARQKKNKETPDYKTYINSRAWKNKRVEYWEDPYTYKECYVCADPWVDFKGKELHHRTYDRLGHERLDDLVPVCPGCHRRISEMWKLEKKKDFSERRTLWEITDLTQEMVRGIVTE